MGLCDLPRGNFELLLKKKGRGNHKAEWKSVMMTDSLYPGEVEEAVERWSERYKVMGCRYNGREITPQICYHWEHWATLKTPEGTEEQFLGSYRTRAEAQEAWVARRMANRGKPKDERVPVGYISFTTDV